MVRILAMVAAVLLAGCATTDGLAPTSKVAGFDGARVVDIAPHGAVCDALPCVSIGAQWSARHPDTAIVTVMLLGPKFSGIQRMALSIDGRERSFQPSGITRLDPGLSALVRESRQDFALPLSVLREAHGARRVWIRVSTLDGYIDQAVIDGPKDSKALHAIGRFLTAVDGR